MRGQPLTALALEKAFPKNIKKGDLRQRSGGDEFDVRYEDEVAGNEQLYVQSSRGFGGFVHRNTRILLQQNTAKTNLDNISTFLVSVAQEDCLCSSYVFVLTPFNVRRRRRIVLTPTSCALFPKQVPDVGYF